MRYTVFRDNIPLTNCTNIPAHGCDNADLTYDGHDSTSTRCEATNNGGKGVVGARVRPPSGAPPASRRRGARGAWLPPGSNNQARAELHRARRRGAPTRIVRVYVDGAKVQQLAG